MIPFDTDKYYSIVSADTFYKTENNYKLEGKVAPRLHNEGETDIYVLNTKVEPGQQFNFSSNGFTPMDGSISIIIMEEDDKKSKAVVVYNTIIKKEC